MAAVPDPKIPAARNSIVADFLASLVVFMVALPLCIGIAQACGLPPETGIITGIVGGLLVGFLAGSPLQVSGPAAGLIGLVIPFISEAKTVAPDTNPAVLLGVTIALAGLLQIVAGALKLGQWFRAVSPAVVEGMLAGIGVTIIAKQFHELVDGKAPEKILDALLAIPRSAALAFEGSGGAANHAGAAVVGVLCVVILAGWGRVSPRRLKIIPAAVIAVLVAALLNEFGRPLFGPLGLAPGSGSDLGLKRVQVAPSFVESVRPIAWPGWGVLGLALVWKGAVMFALIASAETLLCAVAVDTKHTGPRTKFNRELMAQGVGNAVSGVFGALPMTGVIVRSAANVEAGAKTRLSAILHGLWLLLFVSLLPGLLGRIPTSALAAVLVYTGWRLLNLPGLWALAKENWREGAIFFLTAAVIVGRNLLDGVLLGVGLSALNLLFRLTSFRVTRADEEGVANLYVDGAATFLRLPILAKALEAVPPGQKIHLHLGGLHFVDHAILHMLETFDKQYKAAGGVFVLDWGRLHALFDGRHKPGT